MNARLLGYIDPGTMQTVLVGAGGLLAAIGSFFLLLLWPLRVVFFRARRRYRRLHGAGKVATACVAVSVIAAVAWGGYLSVNTIWGEQQPRALAPPELAVVRRGPPRFERVMVLGMDGLDPGVMREMMSAGELPNFRRLAEEGTFAELATSNPPASPVAWSTIATGCGPGEHGVFDFLHRTPGHYLLELTLRRSHIGLRGTVYDKARDREGFWAFTSAAGIPTTVIRWPVSFPAEQVTGRFLSGFGVPDLLGGEGRYTYYLSGPVPKDDPAVHHIVEVPWNGRSLETEIKGPATGRNRHVSLPLLIKRTGKDRLRLSIAKLDASVEATRGQWSDWLPVEFSGGLAATVHGYVKFMLTELDPHLKLVTSPIHMDPSQQPFPLTYPASYGRQLQRQLGRFHTLGMPEQVQPLVHRRYGYTAFLAECRTVHHERVRMLDLELERFRHGLLAFVFDTCDRVQHAFWATRDPHHPLRRVENVQRYADVIPGMYRQMDDVLGRVLAKIDSRTALLVVSDHGFTSYRRSANVNRWLIEHGYMHLKSGDESPGHDLFADVDWSRTQAYAYGFASLSLNLAGRESYGIVELDRYRSLCEQIAAQLREWTDPETGEPVVHNAYLVRDIYHGPDVVTKGPDLLIGLNRGYRASWSTAVGGAPIKLLEDQVSRWSGDHLIDPSLVPGILFSNQKLSVEHPTQPDIFPTVLGAFGLASPDYVQGRPLF